MTGAVGRSGVWSATTVPGPSGIVRSGPWEVLIGPASSIRPMPGWVMAQVVALHEVASLRCPGCPVGCPGDQQPRTPSSTGSMPTSPASRLGCPQPTTLLPRPMPGSPLGSISPGPRSPPQVAPRRFQGACRCLALVAGSPCPAPESPVAKSRADRRCPNRSPLRVQDGGSPCRVRGFRVANSRVDRRRTSGPRRPLARAREGRANPRVDRRPGTASFPRMPGLLLLRVGRDPERSSSRRVVTWVGSSGARIRRRLP